MSDWPVTGASLRQGSKPEGRQRSAARESPIAARVRGEAPVHTVNTKKDQPDREAVPESNERGVMIEELENVMVLVRLLSPDEQREIARHISRRLAAMEEWATMTREERQALREAEQRAHRQDMAAKWAATLETVKSRSPRNPELEAVIRKFIKLFE